MSRHEKPGHTLGHTRSPPTSPLHKAGRKAWREQSVRKETESVQPCLECKLCVFGTVSRYMSGTLENLPSPGPGGA